MKLLLLLLLLLLPWFWFMSLKPPRLLPSLLLLASTPRQHRPKPSGNRGQRTGRGQGGDRGQRKGKGTSRGQGTKFGQGTEEGTEDTEGAGGQEGTRTGQSETRGDGGRMQGECRWRQGQGKTVQGVRGWRARGVHSGLSGLAQYYNTKNKNDDKTKKVIPENKSATKITQRLNTKGKTTDQAHRLPPPSPPAPENRSPPLG